MIYSGGNAFQLPRRAGKRQWVWRLPPGPCLLPDSKLSAGVGSGRWRWIKQSESPTGLFKAEGNTPSVWFSPSFPQSGSGLGVSVSWRGPVWSSGYRCFLISGAQSAHGRSHTGEQGSVHTFIPMTGKNRSNSFLSLYYFHRSKETRSLDSRYVESQFWAHNCIPFIFYNYSFKIWRAVGELTFHFISIVPLI